MDAIFPDDECKNIEPQEDFSLDEFVSEPWYVQKQRVVYYLQPDRFFCTEARYDPNGVNWISRIFGWDILVNNYDENAAGEGTGDGEGTPSNIFGLCAKKMGGNKYPSKLGVSPCFLFPAFFWAAIGPYWVIGFDNEAGWAVVSGGRPTIWTGSGCKNIDNTGLWIFTRNQTGEAAQNATLLALDAARDKGFDVDTLDDFFDVNQTDCRRDYDGFP